MAYMDEQIALKLKKERIKKQKLEKEARQKELEDSIDEEKVVEGIQSGKCEILDRKYEFKNYKVCNGRVSIYLPQEDLNIQKDEENFFQAGSDKLGFSCVVVATNDKSQIQPMSVYKENIGKNLRQFQYRWVEEGATLCCNNKLYYLDFEMLTGIVHLHNQMWFVADDKGQIQTTINYEVGEELYWKTIVKGIRTSLELG